MAAKKTVEYLKEEARLSHVDHDRLMKYVWDQAKIDDDDSESVARQKQKMQEKLAAFEAGFCVRSTKKFKNLTYRVLPIFMEITGLSYRDVLEITNDKNGGRAKINWAHDVEDRMKNACDALASDEERERVREMVVGMLPDSLREILFLDAQSAVKAVKAGKIRQTSYNDIRQKIGKDYSLLNRYMFAESSTTNYDTRLPLNSYNQAIDIFDVSPHWLLGLDENTCVLAKYGTTELIMNAFCLLPMEWKEVMLEAVNLVVKSARGAE